MGKEADICVKVLRVLIVLCSILLVPWLARSHILARVVVILLGALGQVDRELA